MSAEAGGAAPAPAADSGSTDYSDAPDFDTGEGASPELAPAPRRKLTEVSGQERTPAREADADGGDEATEAKPEPKTPAKFTVKVKGKDGKSSTREVDGEELVKNYQLRQESQRVFEEAKELRTTAERVLDYAEKNIGALLTHLPEGSVHKGILAMVRSEDPKVQAQVKKAFAELHEYNQLPEDERRRRQLDEREARLRAEEDRRREHEQQTAAQQETNRAKAAIGRSVASGLRQHGIDLTPMLADREGGGFDDAMDMVGEAAGIIDALRQDGQPVDEETIQEAVSRVARRWKRLLSAPQADPKAAEAAKLAAAKEAASKPAPGRKPAPPRQQKATLTTEQIRARREAERWGK